MGRITQIAVVLMGPLVGILLLQYDLFATIALFGLIAALVGAFVWPQTATWLAIFAIYANLPAVATKFHGVPQFIAASVTLLLAVPLLHIVLVRRQRVIVDTPLLLMFALLAVITTSSLFAKDQGLALYAIWNFLVEGVIIYFLIINVVRSLPALRQVTWALLVAGSLMGAVTLYSELAHKYVSNLGGLAQRKIELQIHNLSSESIQNMKARRIIVMSPRAAGPIGDPNRYAQVMVVLFPLALFRFRSEASRWLKLAAGASALLILAGIFLSYSRGAFVVLILLLGMFMLIGYVRARHVFGLGFVLLALMIVVAPGYVTRIGTIGAIQSLWAGTVQTEADGAITGRMTEMLSALTAFLDHPFLGVGPAHYMPFYSAEYQMNPDIAFRDIGGQRRAHILYFEVAAESGLIGFLIFMTIVFFILCSLWKYRHQLSLIRPELGEIATAFSFSVLAYLGTAIFLHLAYQRYYWLLLATAGAALRIVRYEVSQFERVSVARRLATFLARKRDYACNQSDRT